MLKGKKYEEALAQILKSAKVLSLLEKQNDRTAAIRLRLYVDVYNTHVYLLMGDFKKSDECNKNLGDQLLNWNLNIHRSVVMDGFCYLAFLSFGNNDHKKSLKWLNRILNDFDPGENPIIYFHACVLTIVIHQSQGNDSLVASQFLNCEKFIDAFLPEKNQIKKFILLLKQLFIANNPVKTRRKIFSSMTKLLVPGNEIQKKFFENKFYLSWIRSMEFSISFDVAYNQVSKKLK